jgi:GNAT superfamily N-acetyltransferase
MSINLATTDTEISACYSVMRELRPHIAEEQFLSQVRSQEGAGYRLAYIQETTGVVAIAGFRVGENLAWGRFLYVDDLVTLPRQRSKGHGAKLLSWLKEQAAKEGCKQLHLDSGIQRKQAHRFYEREGMTMASFHFVEKIAPNKALQATPQKRSPEL